MNKEDYSKLITELSDADFLAFLYAEREREESLNSYQGWNLWAIGGAIIAVLCAVYSVLSNHLKAVDYVKMSYLLSGVLSFVMCYRPIVLFIVALIGREKAVDPTKIRKLKDVVPFSYLFFALVCSACCSIVLPIVDDNGPWNLVSILWIVASVLFLIIILFVIIDRDKIVRPTQEGFMFANIKVESRMSGLMCLILCIIWLQSFGRVSSPFVGTPEFEIAVCIAALLFLLYFGARVVLGIKKSSQMDVLIDDYLYNGIPKEVICKKLIISKMGYTILDVCSNGLVSLRSSLKSLDKHKKQLEDINAILTNGSFNIDDLRDYIKVAKVSDSVPVFISEAEHLLNTLSQINKQDIALTRAAEYDFVSRDLKDMIFKLQSYMSLSITVEGKVENWMKVFYCDKYRHWCVEDCSHRHEKYVG